MVDERADTIAETLAAWGADLSAADVPDSVRTTLGSTIVDSGGLMLSGRRADYVLAARDSAEAGGACTAVGHPGGYSAGDAALVSGMAIHGEDFDDTFEGTPVHVGAVQVPALLAVCERDGLGGEDLLRSLAAGGELACRMAVVAPTAIHRAAFHPTAVIGAMSSAFAVSVALGLSVRETANALGIAGSMASGIIEYLAEGTSTKRLHPGWATQSGIRAAALASRGLTGPRTVFEGEHGFYKAFAHPRKDPDLDRLTAGLGETWEVASLAFKPFACGTMAQPFIDAAIELRPEIPDPGEVDSVVAKTSQAIVHRLWEPAAEKARPSTPYSAKFSVPYCIALGLVLGRAGLAEFSEEGLRDSRLLELAAKVRYEIDPGDPYPDEYRGAISVKMKDGRELRAVQPHLRGGRRQPLTDAELESKFRANAKAGGWADADAAEFLEFCRRALTAQSLGGIARFRT